MGEGALGSGSWILRSAQGKEGTAHGHGQLGKGGRHGRRAVPDQEGPFNTHEESGLSPKATVVCKHFCPSEGARDSADRSWAVETQTGRSVQPRPQVDWPGHSGSLGRCAQLGAISELLTLLHSHRRRRLCHSAEGVG